MEAVSNLELAVWKAKMRQVEENQLLGATELEDQKDNDLKRDEHCHDVVHFLGLDLFPSSPDVAYGQLCLGDALCFSRLNRAVKATLLHFAELHEVGSILAGGAETLLRGVFHPTRLYGENRLVLEHKQEEMDM